ncbi:tetratricopeptide repeat protein [Flammeovirgaceae bacterium SG7u.111]|nr:tetratricopeptide repeat protein [Flammeovirgaceae bacterium SG7u.132]WPO35743.1 tetratricopeptide repeat protein [Flammeovirgaceae bacterium SG7u.111]
MKLNKFLTTIFLALGSMYMVQAQDANQDQLLTLLEAYEDAGSNAKKASVMYEVAQMYEIQGVYRQSFEAYEKTLELEENGDVDIRSNVLTKLSQLAISIQKYNKAIAYRKQLITLQESQGNDKAIVSSKKHIANVAILSENYEEALGIYDGLIRDLSSGDSPKELAQAYNNQGYVLKKMGKDADATECFKQALGVYQTQEKLKGEVDIDIFTNIGISYSYLGDFYKAIDYFEKSKKAYSNKGDELNEARSNNYIGATQYVRGDNLQAQMALEDAIKLGEKVGNKEVLSESYKILAEVFAAEKDFEASQNALKKHLDLKGQLEEEAEAKRKEALQRQLEAERNENALKQALAQRREQELALKQAKLEADQRENELKIQQQQFDLLSREKELQETQLANQKLEKQRVQQALQLAKEQLDKQQSAQEIAALQQERERQIAELKQKELEESERQKAMELLQAEKKIQEQELAQESANKKFYLGGFVLIGAFLAFALYSLIQRSKANKVLKFQQEEIQEKNEELSASEEELRQNMEELKATQEVLSEQKETLQSHFQKITHSITYAETIQNAILPPVSLQQKLFPESFLIYKPKDIVSGDFYWCSTNGKKRVASVIDCTGHGVPGAFMSVIGNNLLSEIIERQEIYDPAKILELLHDQIREKLNQDEGANNDGMDMGICVFEDQPDGTIKMEYAGAKHKLFLAGAEGFNEVDGDRKSIGGKHSSKRTFTNHSITLSKGTRVYLTTDGYLDQANDNRKRFSTGRFREVIQRNHQKPMYEQKIVFDNALTEHQQDSDQRDDITVMGIVV